MEHLKERDCLEELGWIEDKQDGRVYWIHLTQDRDKWQALVNMVMQLQFP
jgi:hypothetical protein